MEYDIVVVGAGPAGSTAAKTLAEQGLSVLLIDKEKFPRDKPCGGGLPIRVLNRFKYVKDKGLIESYSYGGFAHSSSLKYKVELQRNEPIVAMILRKKFDYELVKLAIESGSVFIDEKSAKDIKILKDKARILLNDGTNVESQIVIGADGVWSNIAKKSGLNQSRKNVGICLFQEYPMSSETLDRFFGEKRLCHIHMKLQGIAGYGWVFPKKEHLNIGIVEYRLAASRPKGKTKLSEVYKNYINILKGSKIIPDDLKMGRVKGWALPIFPLEKTYSDRVILCGDAGGFINPVSGEGIYYAMSSGEIAARVITEALEVGETDERFLSMYQKNWKNDFGRDIKLLSRSAKQWTKENEKFVKLASRDEKLADMALGILHGRLSIHEYRWKLIRRYLYVYFKEMFSK
jgi:geranylgeranyl reductase family protein